MQVISLTEGKIKKINIGDKEIITKVSSFDEIKQIESARKILKNQFIVIENKQYSFHVPKIYDYNHGIIYMEFMHGNNLELSLRGERTHKQSAKITNTLFQYLFDNKIYWKDFAPRNIMIDELNRTINICDFERGITQHISNKEYLQNYVYEEYSAFLLPQERTFEKSLQQIFTVDSVQNISLEDIKSKRVKSIINAQKLSPNKITNQVVANINKMIILAETPYRQKEKLVFPIIELEAIKDKSYQDFAKAVLNIINKGIYKNDQHNRI